jgi:small GTP-binding protein
MQRCEGQDGKIHLPSSLSNATYNYDYLVNVAIAGKSRVGKTALFNRTLGKEFPNNHLATIGTDFGVKYLGNLRLHLWDLAGEPRFQAIVNSYFRGAHAFLLVFDFTDHDSLDALEAQIKTINEYCTQKTVVKVLVGTKSDLTSQIEHHEAQEFQKRHSIDHFVTVSSLENTNIDLLLDWLAERLRLSLQGWVLIPQLPMLPDSVLLERLSDSNSDPVTNLLEHEINDSNNYLSNIMDVNTVYSYSRYVASWFGYGNWK